MFYKRQDILTFREHLGLPPFVLVRSVLVIFKVILCFAFCFICLRAVSSSQYDLDFWIVHYCLLLRVFFYFLCNVIVYKHKNAWFLYLPCIQNYFVTFVPYNKKFHVVNWGEVRYLSYSFRINVNIFHVMLFSLVCLDLVHNVGRLCL